VRVGSAVYSLARMAGAIGFASGLVVEAWRVGSAGSAVFPLAAVWWAPREGHLVNWFVV